MKLKNILGFLYATYLIMSVSTQLLLRHFA